ncbi:MAG: hypothetical protein ACI4VW_03345 [Acutalibacteraceae bacterium]
MICTFFGHRDAPKEIEPTLRTTLIDFIENRNVTEFFVGNNGNFDAMVRHQLEELSIIHFLNYRIVLAYMPTSKITHDDLKNSILPVGIENVPKRYAISWRNKWMIQQSDLVVTYVTHTFGGAYQFKESAKKQGKEIIVISKKSKIVTNHRITSLYLYLFNSVFHSSFESSQFLIRVMAQSTAL